MTNYEADEARLAAHEAPDRELPDGYDHDPEADALDDTETVELAMVVRVRVPRRWWREQGGRIIGYNGPEDAPDTGQDEQRMRLHWAVEEAVREWHPTDERPWVADVEHDGSWVVEPRTRRTEPVVYEDIEPF